MDRPRTSYGRPSITTLWRPWTGHDNFQALTHDRAAKVSSHPGASPVMDQDVPELVRGGPLDSFGHESDAEPGANMQSRSAPSRTLSAPDAAPLEVKSLGRMATRRAKLSALFTPRAKESGSTQEDRSQHHRYMRPTSWLRRARSTTLRITRRPTQEREALEYSSMRDLDVAELFPTGETAPESGRFLRGGEAARAAAAAAAADRERLDISRSSPVHRDLSKLRDLDIGDSESGIGIEPKDGSDEVLPKDPLPKLDPAKLPPELFEHILSYLDASSIFNAELVSKKWLETASSYRIWRGIFGSDFRRRRSISLEVPLHVGGLGLGSEESLQNWKQMWKARKALDQRWRDGHAAAVYLEGHKDSVYCVQFDENKIITGSRDRTIRIWDARTYSCLKVLGVPKSSQTNHNFPLLGDRMNRQKPFHSMTPTKATADPKADPRSMNHHGSVLCLQFDAEIMVTGSSDTTLIIWDLKADYEPIHRLRRHQAGVLDVCFDATHIASCSKDTTICLWERSTGSLVRVFTGHHGPVNAVQLRGQHIVSASGDGIAKLWNIATGNCVKEFPSKDRGLACVEFSPDSRTILAGGNDQVIYQFDANTGELVRELAGHAGLVRSLHLDSVNGRVISGSYDYSVKAFDVGTGEMLCDFAGWTTSWMLSAKADYRRIVATSQDGRAVIMDFGHGLKGVELLENKGKGN